MTNIWFISVGIFGRLTVQTFKTHISLIRLILIMQNQNLNY